MDPPWFEVPGADIPEPAAMGSPSDAATAEFCGGLPIAWISAWNAIGGLFFIVIWSNAIAIDDDGSDLSWAFAAVTCPVIFVPRGIATCPFDSRSDVVLATTGS